MAKRPVAIHGQRELVSGSLRLGRKIGDRAAEGFLDVAHSASNTAAAKMPHRSGRMASAVWARKTKRGAKVGISKRQVPYAGWIEFGGSRGRPYVAQGRYLYPTAKAAAGLLERAGAKAARIEIGRFHWPSVSR